MLNVFLVCSCAAAGICFGLIAVPVFLTLLSYAVYYLKELFWIVWDTLTDNFLTRKIDRYLSSRYDAKHTQD